MVQRDLHGSDALPSDDTMSESSATQEAPQVGIAAGRPVRKSSPAQDAKPSEPFEPAIQFVSRAAGPMALIAVLIGLYLLIF